MPLTVCTEPGCHELTLDRYCGDHLRKARLQARRFQQGVTAYNSAKWLRLRDRFRETHPFCVNDGKEPRCTCLTDIVDHVVPHEGNEELMFDEANLQPMCWSCHSRKTVVDMRQRRQA